MPGRRERHRSEPALSRPAGRGRPWSIKLLAVILVAGLFGLPPASLADSSHARPFQDSAPDAPFLLPAPDLAWFLPTDRSGERFQPGWSRASDASAAGTLRSFSARGFLTAMRRLRPGRTANPALEMLRSGTVSPRSPPADTLG